MWEIGLGLLGTAGSLAGLAWNRDSVRKVAFIFLALLGLTLASRAVWDRVTTNRLEEQVVRACNSSIMSADQLYEKVNTGATARRAFDAALNGALESGRLVQRVLDLRTPDNIYIRTRVYSTP